MSTAVVHSGVRSHWEVLSAFVLIEAASVDVVGASERDSRGRSTSGSSDLEAEGRLPSYQNETTMAMELSRRQQSLKLTGALTKERIKWSSGRSFGLDLVRDERRYLSTTTVKVGASSLRSRH